MITNYIKTRKPKISVIIPVFNAAAYLNDSISSVLRQTYRDLEVVVVNDGSTDDSESVIRKYERLDNRIRYITLGQNRGVSVARNAALDCATGDYVMFVDADDYLIGEECLSSLVSYLDKVGYPDVVQFRSVDDNRNYRKCNRIMDITADDLARQIASENINSLWTKIYKKNIIDGADGFQQGIRMGEDLLFNIQYYAAAKSYAYFNQEIYFYRRDNTESATKKYMPTKYNDLMYVNHRIQQLLQDRSSKKLADSLRYIKAKNVLSCIRDLHNKDCPMTQEQKVATIKQYKSDNSRLPITFRIGFRAAFVTIVYRISTPRTLYLLGKVLAWRASR